MPSLTYARIITKVANLLLNLPSHLAPNTTAAHRAELEGALRSALDAGQKSILRNPFVFTPIQLKRWLEQEFDAINERHNQETRASVEAVEGRSANVQDTGTTQANAPRATPAGPRRSARNAAKAATKDKVLRKARAAGVKKLAPKKKPVMNTVPLNRVIEEVEEAAVVVEEDTRAAAQALLDLMQHVPRRAAELPPVPAVFGSPREAFLAGARYAWEVRGAPAFGDPEFLAIVEEKVWERENGGVRRRSFWDVV